MLKKLTVLGIALLIMSILIKSSGAAYLTFTEDIKTEAENYGKTHPDIFLPQDQTIDIITKTERKILEEKHRREYNWWKIAKTEWGTVGIPTVGYFNVIDYNVGGFPLASAIILTPFLIKAAAISSLEVNKDKIEQAKEEAKILYWEISTKMGELCMSYAWFFHMPFIVWSSKKFPAGTKYILRFYPRGREKKEVESIFSFDRESKISESRNAGFFYYLAFSAEELLTELSFSDEEAEPSLILMPPLLRQIPRIEQSGRFRA